MWQKRVAKEKTAFSFNGECSLSAETWKESNHLIATPGITAKLKQTFWKRASLRASLNPRHRKEDQDWKSWRALCKCSALHARARPLSFFFTALAICASARRVCDRSEMKIQLLAVRDALRARRCSFRLFYVELKWWRKLSLARCACITSAGFRARDRRAAARADWTRWTFFSAHLSERADRSPLFLFSFLILSAKTTPVY